MASLRFYTILPRCFMLIDDPPRKSTRVATRTIKAKVITLQWTLTKEMELCPVSTRVNKTVNRDLHATEIQDMTHLECQWDIIIF